jgi:hypothetical protein
MKAQINQLLKILRGMYLMLWILPILLCVLYETGILTDGIFCGDARMEYMLQTVCILLTICLIPLSLRLFNLNLVKHIKELPLEEALKSYRRWSEIRLLLLCVPVLLNTSFYYLTLNTTGVFCASMALIASFFCLPTESRIINELDLPDELYE